MVRVWHEPGITRKKQKSQSTLDFDMSKMNTAQSWVNIKMINNGLREDNNSNNSPRHLELLINAVIIILGPTIPSS